MSTKEKKRAEQKRIKKNFFKKSKYRPTLRFVVPFLRLKFNYVSFVLSSS